MVDVIGKAKVVVETVIDKSSLDTSSGKIGAGIKKGALIGVAALGTLAAAGIKSVAAFEEAESVSRKLNNTLDNMGKSGAAEAVDKLSTSLARQTGVDDSLIQKGQTLLATFSQVAESAGETGGTFERATRAAVDLAAAGFGSVESASVQLGKALQDPEKGITALQKSGVTFTETQREQIKNFVETGEVAEAQNIILQEVERQVQGTAEAGAKSSQKLQNAIGDAQEAIGGLIVDLFESGKGDKSFVELAADATNRFGDSVKKFQESKDWKDLRRNIRDYGKDLKTVAGTLTSIVGSMDKLTKKATGAGFLEWANKIDSIVNPLRQLAGLLESIKDTWDALTDRGGSNFSSGARDLTVEDLLGGGFAGGGRTPSGFILAGENGPELIEMGSQGGYVHNNSETRNILSNTGGDTINNYWQFYGPESLSQARQQEDWSRSYGTRFGSATRAVTA